MVSFVSQERLLTQEEIFLNHDPTPRGDSKHTYPNNGRGVHQTMKPITTSTTSPQNWMVPHADHRPEVVVRRGETTRTLVDRDSWTVGGGSGGVDVASCGGSCGWTEDDYLRSVVPWASPEQRAYIDFLLERRAHYRMVRRLSLFSIFVVVVMVGCSMTMGVPSSSTTSSSSAISNVLVIGILCFAPLVRMAWEGNHQHAVVDKEIQKLTQQQLLLVPTPPSTRSTVTTIPMHSTYSSYASIHGSNLSDYSSP